MANINVSLTNTFNEWRLSTNEIGDAIGDAGTLANGITIENSTHYDVVSCLLALTNTDFEQNVNVDWNETDSTEDSYILNKPTLVSQDDVNTNTTAITLINGTLTAMATAHSGDILSVQGAIQDVTIEVFSTNADGTVVTKVHPV